MKFAIGSDKKTHLTEFVGERISQMGHSVELCGVLRIEGIQWPDVALEVAEKVSSGVCDEGVLFCWTGTGVSIAANKVPGVRASLCLDYETARIAKKCNHANILVMSLRLTSVALATEILDAWFSTDFGSGQDAENVEKVKQIEKKYYLNV